MDAPPHVLGRVLVVDDLQGNIAFARALLAREGYVVDAATNGIDALEKVRTTHPDLILLDVRMAGQDGIETCRILKQDPATRLIPIILVTGFQDSDDRVRGLEAGADDFITKPFNIHELRARMRSLIRIKRHTDDLESAESVIVSLALTIEARDAATEGHCQRLADYAVQLGRAVGLAPSDLAALWRGGFLHDIGKVGVPDSILLKPGPLTRAEYDVMKQHAVIGDHLCGHLRSLQRVRPIVRHHHERLDGSGYPDGLAGDDIPLLAQIIAVVDVFDALTTSRPYKPAMSADRSFDELLREANHGWRRRDLVVALRELHGEGRLTPSETSPVTKTSVERPA